MKRLRWVAVVLVVLLVAGTPVGASPPAQSSGDYLSTYWPREVQRWAPLIAQYGRLRTMDPDFLAAVIWMESGGDYQAVSSAGAVGLMQVMPRETGFLQRPNHDALLDPTTNVHWGTYTLSIIMEQGRGDLLNGLAAYNGGWERTGQFVPRSFAVTIMRHYAMALAERHALEGRWIAFFAVRHTHIHGPIWIADGARSDVYFYGRANRLPEGAPLIPDVPPTATVARCDAAEGGAYDVGVWLFRVEDRSWVPPLASP